MGFIKKYLDWVVSLSAFIISLSAMIATFWQAKIMKDHNELSVRPRLIVANTNGDNEEQYVFSDVIFNKGIGPAIVKWSRFKGNDQWLQSSKEIQDFYFEILDKQVDNLEFGRNQLIDGSVIEAGSLAQVNILKWKFHPDHTLNFIDNKKQSLKFETLKLSICYCSMYEECWIASMGEKAREVEKCIADPNKDFKG